jgi:hypothetical protein
VTLDTAGATLLVAVLAGYADVPTISDGNGNTWNYLTAYYAGGTESIVIAYAYSKGGGALVVGSGHTFTVSSGAYDQAMIYAFSRTNTTSAVLGNNTGNAVDSGASQTIQPGSVTPTIGDVVITGVTTQNAYAVNPTIDESFNTPISPSVNRDSAASYLVVSIATPLNPTWSTDVGSNRAAIACFHAA